MYSKLPLSVVVSVFQGVAHFPQFMLMINSFTQYFYLELVIVANDWTDDESKILADLIEEYQLLSRKKFTIKLIETKRETVYASWNRGIAVCNNDSILITNIDDILFPLHIHELVKKMIEASDYDVFCGSLNNKQKHTYHRAFGFDELPSNACLISGGFVIRKKLIEDGFSFNEHLSIVGDFLFQMEVIKANRKIYRHPFSIGVYNNMHDGISTSQKSNLYIEQQMIYYYLGMSDKITCEWYSLRLSAGLRKLTCAEHFPRKTKNLIAFQSVIRGTAWALRSLVYSLVRHIF